MGKKFHFFKKIVHCSDKKGVKNMLNWIEEKLQRGAEWVKEKGQPIIKVAKKIGQSVKAFFSNSQSAREQSEQATKEKAQSNARKTSGPIVETARIAAVTKEGQTLSQEITSSTRQNNVLDSGVRWFRNLRSDIGDISKRMTKGLKMLKIRLSTKYLTLKKAIYQLPKKVFKSDQCWSAINCLQETNLLKVKDTLLYY